MPDPHDFLINHMEAATAGRDVNSPVTHFHGNVQMNNPIFGTSTPLGTPPAASKPPKKEGPVRKTLQFLKRFSRRSSQSSGTKRNLDEEPTHQTEQTTKPRDFSLTPMSNFDVAISVKGDISVLLLQELDKQSLNLDCLKKPDMYVYKMLSSQEGLACWETVDLGRFAGTRGVLLGDVGTYSPKGGFKKVFNLWDDVVPIRCTEGTFKEVTYSPPKKHATTHQGALRRGDTIAEGASARTVPGRHRDIERFEFDCKDQPNGAVLALTSPADRETLDDCEGLRNHIIDNAELFYRHADLQRTIGANQPVYIITGSLKSETCGLAVFISPMQSGKDTIKLEYSSQLSLPSGRQPVLPFQWTDKWTAEARTPSGQQSGVKDLSLFLQGFKLDFSDAFRARMKPESNAAGHSRTLGSGGTDGDGGGSGVGEDNAREGSGFSGSSGEGAQQESRGEGGAGFGSGTQSREQALEPNTDRPTSEDTDRKGAKPVEDITIKSFPSTGREVAYHPCDTINEFLLKHTDASFALTHDEDWKHLLDSRTLFSARNKDVSKPGPPNAIYVSTRTGTAFLEFSGGGRSRNMPSSFNDAGNWNLPSSAEIYTYHMEKAGLGLPSWSPNPRPTGSLGPVPGDVGLFSPTDGFTQLLNIWDDEEAIQKIERRRGVELGKFPRREVRLTVDKLPQGYVATQGVELATTVCTEDGSPVRYEFTAESQSGGAVLVVTSPADLEDCNEPEKIRASVVRRAESIMELAYLRNKWASPTIYLVTGCVKTESCALAAFPGNTGNRDNDLRLEAIVHGLPGDKPRPPKWVWTRQGYSATRISESPQKGVKNQTLFLRGFKLDFSPTAVDRILRGSANEEGGDNQGGLPSILNDDSEGECLSG